MKYCSEPFTSIEVNIDGNVYTCCPSFINSISIGNIFKDSFEDIWYSKAAIEIRQSILDGSYSKCNLSLCRQINCTDSQEDFVLYPPPPCRVTLSYDKECNLYCLTCRDKKYVHSKENLDFLNSKIETVLLPLLKNTDELHINGSGEALYSKHCRNLLKNIVTIYPKIRLFINTNGTMCNQKVFDSLGGDSFLDKVEEFHISFPAFDENIYNKIMRGSNYQAVKNNLEFLSDLKKQNKFKNIYFNIVVSDVNYKEIPSILNYAEQLGFYAMISQYMYWGTEFGKIYEQHAVWENTHPCFNEFCQILKSIDTSKIVIFLAPAFEKIRNL